MSTVVDNVGLTLRKRPRSSAKETRSRVLQAARIAFCQSGFDHVGVREIAARAGTDAAIIIRLFGSKEALFRAVATAAFALEPAFEAPPEDIGNAIATFLLASADTRSQPDDFDAFLFLLRSATSPVGSPIVASALHAGFVLPMAAHFGGDEAVSRAALVTACVLGFTTMRFALDSPPLKSNAEPVLRARLAAAIQACIQIAA